MLSTHDPESGYYADASQVTANGADPGPCGIAGNWTNQLGSSVTFECQDGILSGRYNSAVGNASNYYNLRGTYTMSGPALKDATIGFSVAWNNTARGNSQSTTSWTGVHYASTDVIYTTWILTRYTALADKWRNSFVDQDVFKR